MSRCIKDLEFNKIASVPARVLLVDDDLTFRNEFKECFQEFGVVEASNGEEALRILKRPNQIDVVILDVRMSGMNGIEVLSRMKMMAPDIRIVILTGYSSKDVAVEALRGKADDYLEKPLDVEATKELLERLLRSKKGKNCDDGGDIRSRIERVKDFVQRNCLKKVTLDDAAQDVCLSPKYLSRVFKEYARTGFNDYKLSLKIDHAKLLLKKTSYNIDQISDKLGYQNSESFIRQFKKITKKTPTEFRRSKAKK